MINLVLLGNQDLFRVKKTVTQILPDGTQYVRKSISGINDNSNKYVIIDSFYNPRNIPIKMIVRIYADDKDFAEGIVEQIKKSTKTRIELEIRDIAKIQDGFIKHRCVYGTKQISGYTPISPPTSRNGNLKDHFGKSMEPQSFQK